MNIRLKTFPFAEELIIQCLETLRRILPTLEAFDGVMLSGGRTPLEIYRRAAAEDLSTAGKLFLSDERYVPADDPQSNYGTIQPFFPSLLKINTGLPLEAAALAFHADLSTLKKIPLGLLGLGTDGHTASLFSLAEAALRGRGLAIPVIKDNKPDRISVTPAMLNRIDKIVILATGAEKIKIVQTLLENPDTIPSGVALADHPNVELWTDQP